VTEVEAGDVADSCGAILADLNRLYPPSNRLVLKPTHARATHIAHGWFMRVHRGCAAVMLLREGGFAAESWPVRRSVLEHVVALKWLAVEGSKIVDPLIRQLAKQASTRRDGATAADWGSADMGAFEDVISDGRSAMGEVSQDTYFAFKHRCDEYGSKDDWASWLIESAHSHPGWETAAPYLEPGPSVRLLGEPGVVDRDDAGWCAMKMWEALAALSRMMEDPPWESDLAGTRERIHARVAAHRATQQ
jgi:hypothetical protein